MNTAERREEILRILGEAETPVAARELAARFGVSRQVIVQDMAVIRASTPGILSTTKGYAIQQENTCTREFKVRHRQDQAAEELNLIVDCGGRVKNISISHRVYGRISAEMDIRSRQDVREFTEALASSHSTVLSTATSGYHYHLVEAANKQRLDLIGKELEKAGFLAPLQPWEKRKNKRAIKLREGFPRMRDFILRRWERRSRRSGAGLCFVRLSDIFSIYGNYVLTFAERYTRIYEHVYRSARVCSCDTILFYFGNGGVPHWLTSNLLRREF